MGRKKADLKLKVSDSNDEIKGLEESFVKTEVDCDFEGGATFYPKGKITTNTRRDYVLKNGKRHVLNISNYLKGKCDSIYKIRIYKEIIPTHPQTQ